MEIGEQRVIPILSRLNGAIFNFYFHTGLIGTLTLVSGGTISGLSATYSSTYSKWQLNGEYLQLLNSGGGVTITFLENNLDYN